MASEHSTTEELKELFEAPAHFIEHEVEVIEWEEELLRKKRPLKYAEEYWETLGPGLTTGAADNDPSGIATYSQVGAQYGLKLSWLTLFTFPLLAIVQEMCARIGIVSGKGLAANIRNVYKPQALYGVAGLLFIANVVNIGADLAAMAAAFQLLVPRIGASVVVIVFAAFSLVLQIFSTYARYAKYLKYLAITLVAYIAVAFVVHPDWLSVVHHAFIPAFSFSKTQILLLCAIFGTTISPYLFFWQTSQEVEESMLRNGTTDEKRLDALPRTIRRMRADVWSGMAFSNIVGFFIVVACASTLFAHGVTTIASAAQAAQALRPFGVASESIFALGIISTGLLAIPVLAGSSAYAFSESFGWRQGLYRKLKDAYAFYGVIIVAMALAVVLTFLHVNPIEGLVYAAIVNGLIAPVMLFFIIRLSASARIMGSHANSRIISVFGWITFAVMALAGVAAIVSLF